MRTVARPAGDLCRASVLLLSFAAFCLASLPVADAVAHVRTPDYGRLDRNPGGVLPEYDGGSRLELRGEPKESPAVSGKVCAFSSATNWSLPPISEVSLQGVRAAGPATQEIFALLETLPTPSEMVRVALGATADGAPCALYVSIGTEDADRQTFWRFAPNDEPDGWFDDDGRRLGAALTPPMPGSRTSSPFGPRRYYGRPSGGGFHDGIDYEARIGQPILAAADGIIELQGPHFEYGLTVKIRHADQFTTLYAHMSHFARGTAVGSRVSKGEVIGYVGMTGRSTGAHLHFSTIVNGKFSDPAPYLFDSGDRSLNARTLVGFRKWQDDVRRAVQQIRDRQQRNPVQDDGWTSRL